MDLNDLPLLNEPNVMLVALKTAAEAPASPQDCMEQLRAWLRLAGHDLPDDADEDGEALYRRIVAAYHSLQIARMVDRDAEGRFAITERGRSTLKAHPMGIDTSVLADFPEYRAFIRRRSRQRARNAVAEPARGYNEGYMRALAGGSITDNPYSVESFTHLEWENGWCEGFEQKSNYIPTIRNGGEAGSGGEGAGEPDN